MNTESKNFKKEKIQKAIFSSVAAGGGAYMGVEGAKDILNKKILLSYGASKQLGKGHETPAMGIRKLIEEIKQEDAANRKGLLAGLDITNVNTIDDKATLSNDMVEKIKKNKYIATIDTGWGLVDPNPSHPVGVNNAVDRVSRSNWLYKNLPLIGDSHQQIPDMHRRVGMPIAFFPDGAGFNTGLHGTGFVGQMSKNPNFTGITYGTFDPGVTNYASNSNLKYTGLTSPFVESMGGGRNVLDQAAYEDLVHKYLTDSGHNIAIDDIRGKKIIPVSGASRGDSVGAKAKWIHNAIQNSKNHNIDDYLILGIGSGGVDRETQIALADGIPRNLFIGGRPGGPKGGPTDFVNLAGNGHLHVMGQGSATPPEMLSHGGSPLVTFADEQVFTTKEGLPWSTDGVLDRTRGILGLEEELIRKAKKRGIDISPSAERGWMNQLVFQDPVNGEVIINRGLDGVREYGDLRGIKELNSTGADDFLSLLDDKNFLSKDRVRRMAELTEGDLASGTKVAKGALRQLLQKARINSIIKGSGKAGVGAALLGAAAYPFLGSKEVVPETALGSVKSYISNLFGQGAKTASISSGGERNSKVNYGQLGGAVGLAGLSAGLIDTHDQLSTVDKMTKGYRDAITNYVKKYPRDGLTLNPGRIEEMLSVLDQYAVAGEGMSNRRIMGIPANKIFKRMPLTTFIDSPRTALLSSIGILPKDTGLARQIVELRQHYGDAADDLRKVLTKETLTGSPLDQRKLFNAFVTQMSEAEADKIINAGKNVPLQDRFSDVIKTMRTNYSSPGNIMSEADVLLPLQAKENRFIRGMGTWEDLVHQTGTTAKKVEQAMHAGSASYANKAVKIFNRIKGPLKGLAGLSALGAGVLGYNAVKGQ